MTPVFSHRKKSSGSQIGQANDESLGRKISSRHIFDIKVILTPAWNVLNSKSVAVFMTTACFPPLKLTILERLHLH